MYKLQLSPARDRELAEVLKDLLEAYARWNEEHGDAAKNEIWQIVDAAEQSNPEIRKEMINSCERGFIEDKEEEKLPLPKKTILRKIKFRKSDQEFTKEKIVSETVKISPGSIYRKWDMAEAKFHLQLEPTQGSSRSPSGERRKKLQKISSLEKL